MTSKDFTPYVEECFDALNKRFQYLFEAELIHDICRHSRIRTFSPNDILIDIGDPITHIPLVIQGAIKVFTEDNEGQELILYFLELGDTCAVTLNCCTRKTNSTIRAMAETSAKVVLIPVEKLEEWMITYKSWRAFVLDSFNTRMNELIEAIDMLVFQSLEERLINYLKNKAWATKSDVLKISHADIAQDLHSSRVVISRIMKKLELNKIINQHRGQVKLLKL